jgi:hypothetical protein
MRLAALADAAYFFLAAALLFCFGFFDCLSFFWLLLPLPMTCSHSQSGRAENKRTPDYTSLACFWRLRYGAERTVDILGP